jgi:hypothetical protein
MQVSPQRHDRLRRRRRAARRLAARRAAEATTTPEVTEVPEVTQAPKVTKTPEPSQKGTVVTGPPKIPAQRSGTVRPGTLGKTQPAIDRP